MVVACIDIGSNTTRLLVAATGDGELRELAQRRAFTRLGAAGELPAAKIAATADVVAEQVRVARECGAERVRVVGTHAIRQAANRDDLVREVERRAGVRVDVLGPEDEARLAFAGATKTLAEPPAGEVGVVDVGGGSSEIVCGTAAGGVSWSRSFAVGSGVLADAHLRSDPPAEAELDAVRARAAEVFAGLGAPSPDAAYAVGGSATSLCRLAGEVLDRPALARAVDALRSAPAAEVARRFDLHVERVRLLPAGIILLDAAAAALDVALHVARGGLREGVVLEELSGGDRRAA